MKNTEREVADKIRTMNMHKRALIGWHPGDDSPYSGIYGGYTVRDTRRAITNRIKYLKK